MVVDNVVKIERDYTMMDSVSLHQNRDKEKSNLKIIRILLQMSFLNIKTWNKIRSYSTTKCHFKATNSNKKLALSTGKELKVTNMSSPLSRLNTKPAVH
jgi:hypothetical protein